MWAGPLRGDPLSEGPTPCGRFRSTGELLREGSIVAVVCQEMTGGTAVTVARRSFPSSSCTTYHRAGHGTMTSPWT